MFVLDHCTHRRTKRETITTLNQELSSRDILGGEKKDKVREGNNERVLVSSGGSSFRTPAGLSWLSSLWTLQRRRVLHTCKANSYALTGNDFSFGNRRKTELQTPVFISLPPSILARKHILKSGRPAGLWWLLLGKAFVGTDSSLLFPGITAMFGWGLHHREEFLSPVTALVHASFNAIDSYAVTYTCDLSYHAPSRGGTTFLSALLLIWGNSKDELRLGLRHLVLLSKQ